MYIYIYIYIHAHPWVNPEPSTFFAFPQGHGLGSRAGPQRASSSAQLGSSAHGGCGCSPAYPTAGATAAAAAAASFSPTLTYTRYCFTSKLYCGRQSSFYCPTPPAKPTLLQYYCTTIAQYTRPPPTPPFYAIHHTILVSNIMYRVNP